MIFSGAANAVFVSQPDHFGPSSTLSSRVNGHLGRVGDPAAIGLLEPAEHPRLSPKHVIVLER
jgi:hypothetical protein